MKLCSSRFVITQKPLTVFVTKWLRFLQIRWCLYFQVSSRHIASCYRKKLLSFKRTINRRELYQITIHSRYFISCDGLKGRYKSKHNIKIQFQSLSARVGIEIENLYTFWEKKRLRKSFKCEQREQRWIFKKKRVCEYWNVRKANEFMLQHKF